MATHSRAAKEDSRTYWDEKFETMPTAELEKFQLRKLKETVDWVFERIPFYRRKLDDARRSRGMSNGQTRARQAATAPRWRTRDRHAQRERVFTSRRDVRDRIV